MNKRYGDKNVKYAIATKLAMKEERGRKDLKVSSELMGDLQKKQNEVENIRKDKEKYTGRTDSTKGKTTKRTSFNNPTDLSKPEHEFHTNEDYKYNVSEEGLRDWFGKSSGTTKSGRKVRGWVQVGGKYDGKPCARQLSEINS